MHASRQFGDVPMAGRLLSGFRSFSAAFLLAFTACGQIPQCGHHPATLTPAEPTELTETLARDTVEAPGAAPPWFRATRCLDPVQRLPLVRIDGHPYSARGVRIDDGIAYVRVPALTPDLALPVNGRDHLDFSVDARRGRVLRRDVDGMKLVALSVPPHPELVGAGVRATNEERSALDRLTASERATLTSLRLGVNDTEVPDLRAFPELRALELVFPPAHDPLWPVPGNDPPHEGDTARWISALPESIELLRLSQPPAAALLHLPTSLARLELSGVTHLPEGFALGLPAANRLTALSVENGSIRLSPQDLSALRELVVPALYDWVFGDFDLESLGALERLTTGHANLERLWRHPTLHAVDLRNAVVASWPPPTDAPQSLRRMIVVDAKSPMGEALDPSSHDGIIYSAVDELRLAITCAYRVVVRSSLATKSADARATVRSVGPLATLLPTLLRESALRNHSVIDPSASILDIAYDGTEVLDLFISPGCARLDSPSWRQHIELAEEAAAALCAWLALAEGDRH